MVGLWWMSAGESWSARILAVFVERYLGGGFKYLLFLPLPGEMIQFDEHMQHIFQMD